MELKSLTQRSKCAGAESGGFRILSECLGDSSMRLGVPFIAPRHLGAVGGQLERPNLPSAGWCSPVHHRTVPVAVRCAISFHFWRIRPLVLGVGWHDHVSREDCATDRWLTGQSGAPPDNPVNYSHVAPLLFPRAMSSPRMTHRTFRCTTGRSGEL